MREQLVNAFLTSAVKAWQEEFGCGLTLVKGEATYNQFTAEEDSVLVGISGAIEGFILYEFSHQTCIYLSHLPSNMADVSALTAIGKMVEVMVSHAASKLSQLREHCQFSPFIIVEPIGGKFTDHDGPQISALFESDVGSLAVRVRLTQVNM